MTALPVRFYTFPRSEVERLTQHAPIPRDFIANYERSRPGILNDDQQDIFCENCRSVNQRWSDFSLFARVTHPEAADFILCQTWLELFEANGLPNNIQHLIDTVLETYPHHKVVFSWNHDVDAAHRTQLRNLPERAFVLNYNTSSPVPNDILLPFWTINTRPRSRHKNYQAGFQGYTGTKLRARLAHAIHDKPGFYYSDKRMPEEEYLNLTAGFRYSLCPRGGGLNSWRFYESIHCGSVPVLFSDSACLPFPELDYRKSSLRIPERDAGDFAEIERVLAHADYDSLHDELEAVKPMFSLLGVQREIYGRLAG